MRNCKLPRLWHLLQLALTCQRQLRARTPHSGPVHLPGCRPLTAALHAHLLFSSSGLHIYLRSYLECPSCFATWQTPTHPSRPSAYVPFSGKHCPSSQCTVSLFAVWPWANPSSCEMEVCTKTTSLKACFEPRDNKQTLDALKSKLDLGGSRGRLHPVSAQCVFIFIFLFWGSVVLRLLF